MPIVAQVVNWSPRRLADTGDTMKPSIRHSLIVALMGAWVAGCVPVMGPGGTGSGLRWPWEVAPPYRYLGISHYHQKRLMDVEGEFTQLAVSPSGKQVVFSGRDSRDDYMMFIGDIGGSVRFLAKTGNYPEYISWSRDEKTLLYLTQETTREGMRPDAPADVPGIPSGKTINLMTIATGEVRRVITLPGIGSFYPSPTHDFAMIYGFIGYGVGYGGNKTNFAFDTIDVASGERRPLNGSVGEMNLTYAGVWSPDGAKMAAMAPLPPGEGDGQRVYVLNRPDWTVGDPIGTLAWNSRLHWSADGQTLSAFQVTREDGFSVTTLSPGAPPKLSASATFDRPPQGYLYWYETVLPSPDGRRAVLTRQAQSTAPQVLQVPERPKPTNLLVDTADKSVREVAPGLVPIAWLNDKQILCHTGRDLSDQAKRLKVVDL